jgi:hypothetical protein
MVYCRPAQVCRHGRVISVKLALSHTSLRVLDGLLRLLLMNQLQPEFVTKATFHKSMIMRSERSSYRWCGPKPRPRSEAILLPVFLSPKPKLLYGNHRPTCEGQS